MEEKIYCSNCGELIDTDDYGELDGEILCSDCLDDYTTVCDFCGARIWSEVNNFFNTKSLLSEQAPHKNCAVLVA